MLREAGIEDGAHTGIHAIINQALQRRFYLRIRGIHAVEKKGPRRGFKGVSGHVPVFPDKIAEPGHRVHRFIRDSVCRKNLGVHPDAVALPFQNHQLAVRTDGVQILLGEGFSLQELLLQQKAVTRQTGILGDIIGHEVQGSLLAVALETKSHIGILETDADCHVYMGVQNTGHDKFAVEVSDLSLVGRKTCLVSHINEFAVFYHQRGGHGIVLVRGEDFCIFNNPVCLHFVLLSFLNPHYQCYNIRSTKNLRLLK